MGAVTPTVIGTNVLVDSQNEKNIRQLKCVMVETANTVDAGDTFEVDIADYGGTLLWGIDGCKHTTDNSVIVTENPTCTVSGTVVTCTVPAGTDNDKRIAKLYFT